MFYERCELSDVLLQTSRAGFVASLYGSIAKSGEPTPGTGSGTVSIRFQHSSIADVKAPTTSLPRTRLDSSSRPTHCDFSSVAWLGVCRIYHRSIGLRCEEFLKKRREHSKQRIG
jgi:hypothetical protein